VAADELAQAVMKIMKHGRDAHSGHGAATGLLLGLDLDGTLEISNAVAVPSHSKDEDDKGTSAAGL